MAQDALNRWWWPSLMMFGPSDAESRQQRAVGAMEDQAFSNDELRQRFVDLTVPQAEFLGPDHPRPGAASGTRRRGHYDFGAIDWSEFHNVLKGNGPCNRERLRTRVDGMGRRRDGCARRPLAHADKQRAARRATSGVKHHSGEAA